MFILRKLSSSLHLHAGPQLCADLVWGLGIGVEGQGFMIYGLGLVNVPLFQLHARPQLGTHLG